MPLSSGSRLGPYEILALQGAGGMGEVYRAHDTRLGRTVAIKVIAAIGAGDSELRGRFEREARAISSLSHPNICALYDIGREGDTDYLVLEYLEGESLAQRIAKGRLPIKDAISLGLQICDALDKAHRANIVHRDLKPGNIFLTANGAKLLDFGLARTVEPAASLGATVTATLPLTAQGAIRGTYQYMAPEQIEGRGVDRRSDVWALGCVLYEMIAGRRPFDGDSAPSIIGAIGASEPPSLPQLDQPAPASVESVIRGCLAKNRDERWQDVRDVDILIVPLTGSGSPQPLVQTPANEFLGRVSPDSRWLAYVSDESGRSEVYVQPLHDVRARRQASVSGGLSPRWRGDSRELFFLGESREQILAVEVEGMNVHGLGVPRPLFTTGRRLRDYDVTIDGRRFLVTRDSPSETGALSAVLNWRVLVKP